MFNVYDKSRIVLGKPMGEWLRPAAAYGPAVVWSGKDMFGAATLPRPWLGSAEATCEAAFAFFRSIGVASFTLLDTDAAGEADDLRAHETALRRIEDRIAVGMAETGLALRWGAADLYSHPRYAAGAATNPDPDVFAYASAQVRLMVEMTHRLGGEAYALLSYREGYDTILNTDIARDWDHLGRFLAMVVEHKHRIGFKGPILIEPKPFEPAKLHYERDVATVFALLQRYDLLADVKISVEVNHATLAGLDFEHEIAFALACGGLGGVEINRGDPRNGWDVDAFAINAQDLTPAMVMLAEAGYAGGFTIDARLRRQSVDPDDLLIAYTAAIETLATALLAAERIISERRLADLKAERYADWNGELGRAIAAGDYSLAALADLAAAQGLDPQPQSGHQELAESIVAQA